MQKRQTIKIEDLKNEVNRLLKIKHLSQEEKLGFCGILEYALHTTHNYKGYTYITTYTDNQEYNRIYF
jgi:hypothetical protein